MQKKWKRACVIRCVWYNKQKDLENYYRGKMMLFLPYKETKYSLKANCNTWVEAYPSKKLLVDNVEK